MLTADEIARRRLIEFISLEKGKGEIWAASTIQRIRFDDLLDLVQAVEMLMLKLTGKVINAKLRPGITNRAALKIDSLIAGGPGLYDEAQGPSPEPHAWYMRVEIDGSVWDNWFLRLDEMVKLLYIIVKEAQGDPYVPPISVVIPAYPHA
jgi:hypothetical protein